jgi:uncharacterized protein (DUF302 family)
MKIKSLLVIVLIVSGLTTIAQNSMEKPDILIESQSKLSFPETIDVLSKAVVAKGWKITIIHDLQETMKKNGKEVLPVKVMEICNPGLAYQILSKDHLREVSPMLPCRISVYQKSDGKTYISRMNAAAFTTLLDPDAAKTVTQAFAEAEDFIRTAVN